MTEPHGVHRVHYHHRTQHTLQLLTASILAYSKKRSYEDYKPRRTADIWTSREELIAYEDALKLDAEVDDLMNDGRAKRDVSIEPENIGGKVFLISVEHMLNLERQTETGDSFGIVRLGRSSKPFTRPGNS